VTLSILALALVSSLLARGATAPRALRQYCNEWQERLGLNDWSISLQMVDSNALNRDALGNVHWNFLKKQATISVLSRWEYTMEPALAEIDQRRTVIHELVHIVFRATANADAKKREEDISERLAQAIVLDRNR
jgi:hypothetical protein